MRRSITDGSGRKARPGGVGRFKSQVLAVIAAIPEGRVTTYGTIGQHLQVTARQVAFILARLTAEESEQLPWFRVVAANGVISTTKLGAVGRRQIARLRSEGVAVTPRNKVEDFRVVAWSPG
ncbi:MAG TPA: MGMT family protein [Gemmata sp.]|jgi:methylated-DNA-protein-cysteine methyltransferase-like protein|nr:MGMT family protein [Gemmata sp.]